MAAITFGGAQSHPPLVQPIIFCGPGSNLYPLCTSTVTADVSQDARQAEQVDLPKAMLPVFNRPMIAYALQQLLSAGLRHAIVFAPSEQHSIIAAALKSFILIPPTLVQSGRKNASSTAAAAAAAAAVEEASKYPNVSVSVGLNSTSTASTAPAAGDPYLSANSFAASSVQSETVMRVDLLPLGPDDITSSKADSRIASPASKYKRLGTAGLISWLHSVGRLDKDPLVLPVDLVTQSVSLTDIINSHISSVLQSPALTCLMYERGAGEGTGKEREKDGPPKLFSAYDRTPLHTSRSSSLDGIDHCTMHQLLLLQDSDDISDIDSSDLHLRMSLLWSHPHVRISTSLLDSHVYLFNLHHLLGLLTSDAGQKMKSLREEVVPFMVKCSWMVGLREKAGWTTSTSKDLSAQDHLPSWSLHSSKENPSDPLKSSTFVDPEFLQAGSSFRPVLDDLVNRSSPLFTPDRSQLASPSGKYDDKRNANLQSQARSSAKCAAAEAKVNTLIFRLSPDRKHPVDPSTSIEEIREREEDAKREPFIARANTVPTYLECNRYLLRCLSNGPTGQAGSSAPNPATTAALPSSALSHPLPNQSLPATAQAVESASAQSTQDAAKGSASAPWIDPKAQISSDSLVETFTRVGERTTVKRSVVGRGCTIGKNVKLTGAIVMDGVRIGDNAKLENCILAAGSIVEEKCNLKDCDVAASVKVPAGSNTKGEKFDE